MAAKHTTTVSGKPRKPSPDFPLCAHNSGLWCKKVRRKIYYFGPWDDPEGALQKWVDQKDDLLAGRKPRDKNVAAELTIRDLVNNFLNTKRSRVENSELSQVTFSNYFDTCERVISAFSKERLVSDLRPDDFEEFRQSLSKTRGHRSLGNEINRVRILFKHAFDNDLIDKPVKFGTAFKRPSVKTIRKTRQAKGKRLFQSDELRAIIDAAKPKMKAMVLLGINCGFGNTDIATLPMSSLDLEKRWAAFPRPKTGVERRVPLWPETVTALKEVLTNRKPPKSDDDADLVFITKYGERYIRCGKIGEHKKGKSGVWIDSLALEFGKLLRELKLHRPGLGFYTLRHSFQTVGGGSLDRSAVSHIMGHLEGTMAEQYDEHTVGHFPEGRLRAVVDHVHTWLFAKPDKQAE